MLRPLAVTPDRSVWLFSPAALEYELATRGADWLHATTPRTDAPIRFAFGSERAVITGVYRRSITYRWTVPAHLRHRV